MNTARFKQTLAWLCTATVMAAILAAGAMTAAFAQALPPADANGVVAPSIASSLPDGGDPSGIRRFLASRGITYALNYTNDVLANVHGGNRVGVIDEGRLEGVLRIDFEKLMGLQGLSFYANIFQIHNTGMIRRDYVGGINGISSIEARPSTRLFELWLEQKFADGKASLRAGQLAADSEFFFSELGTMFLQGGWPTIAAVNLPSGGPAYPLATPGIRLKVDPTNDVSLLIAAFNGDPAGPGPGDEQLRDRYGLNFRTSDPPFVIGEAQFRRNQGKDDTGLATTFKVGGWGHFGTFDDKRFASDGALLADPAGSHVPLPHRGDTGLYAIIDQQLYRPKGGDAQSGVSVFGAGSVSPSDRNLVDVYLSGGVVFAGLIPHRPEDKFGASVVYSKFSDSIQAFDRDLVAFTGVAGPIRDYETNLELTYVAEIVPGWTVQPDLQFVWHPNGDARRNAVVTGVRSMWHY